MNAPPRANAPASPSAPPMDPNRAIRGAHNKQYPREVWWFVASFIALVSICQLVSWGISKLSSGRPVRKQAGDAETAGRSNSPRRFSWRRVPLAAVNLYRVVAFRWTLEIGQSYTLNLAEVFVTAAYIIALFVWEFVNTTTTTGSKLDITYWGGRAGAIGASQLPLVTALGTKNNPIAYITGISYDKLNYIHRMTARVVFVILWIHGGAKWFIRIGLTALVALTVLILVSLRPIRAQVYEVFYFTHFLMVLIFLLGGYFHTNFERSGFYIWPCFLIWGLDRAIRLARLVFYNHLYFGFSKTAKRLDASVELLSPHFVRLHLQRPPHFRWTPGQTAFLTMPGVSGFPLEAHPFTIASVDARYQLNGVSSPTVGDAEKAGPPSGSDATPYWKELVFLINVREGFTKRLAQIAQAGGKVKVLVDGPYGFSPNLDHDDTVVLVAGGSGVSFSLSTFLGVLSHVQNGKSRCRKLVFIWSIREASHIEWVSKALTEALELAPAGLDISIRLFVTSGSTPGLVPADSWNEDDSVHSSEGTATGKSRPSSLLNFSAVQVSQGRPDLPALLRAEVDANVGRLSVTVCGSQGVARACRSALRIPVSTVVEGGPSVVLHVESFGYA
ncbi:Ferric/cupric reductase transmembrane component 2 [Trametes pubescens]|uniref:ferric-chelate reductase (NADPH) n=1 Tax=Trametes pubescens TaxID=154538 RepID=A0A1M2VEK6_TRAPU|nr:Ferric/cupric reductase transmembrane component 2 [Trametes pubescens]